MLRRSSVPILISSLITAGILYIILVQLRQLNELLNRKLANQQISIADYCKLEFSSVEFIIRWNKIGIKFDGVRETNSSGRVSHLAPVHVYINPWQSNLTISYDGESVSTFSGDDRVINLSNNINITGNFQWTAFLLKILIQHQFLEALNYLENFAVNIKKIEAYDVGNKQKIFDLKDTELKIRITRAEYYTSMTQLLNNLPRNYELQGDINILYTTNRQQIAPFSLLYGYLPNLALIGQFKLKFDSKTMDLSLASPLEAAEIVFSCQDCENTNFIFDLNLIMKIVDNNLEYIKTFTSFRVKPTIFEELPEKYVEWQQKISERNPQLGAFLVYPKNILPLTDFDQQFSLNLEARISNKDKVNIIDVNNFIFKNDNNIGIVFRGEGALRDQSKFDLEADIILINYQALLNYWQIYYYKMLTILPSAEIIDFNLDIMLEFLKEISDYPSSAAKDVSFHIVHNSTQKNQLISKHTIPEILAIFREIKLKNALNLARKFADPAAKIKELLPEVDTTIEELSSYSSPKGVKIPDYLWEKLIKN